eukprot:scaffold171944_cov39-Attheya_sp.AAC.2
MAKLSLLLLAVLVAAASAFAPASSSVTKVSAAPVAFVPMQLEMPVTQLSMAQASWEGEYPPSTVLGPILSKMPSGLLGILSIIALASCGYSVHESNVLQQVPGALNDGSWVKWYFVAMGFGGPISWGLHVASWIQRKNGM